MNQAGPGDSLSVIPEEHSVCKSRLPKITRRCSGSQCKNVRAIKPVLSVVTPKIPTVAGVSSKDGEQFVPAPVAWRPGSSGAEMILCPCRCTRKAECSRAEETGHWLWSRDKSCVAITDANPQNMSRRAPGKVCDRWQAVWCGARRGSPYTAAGWELSETRKPQGALYPGPHEP